MEEALLVMEGRVLLLILFKATGAVIRREIP